MKCIREGKQVNKYLIDGATVLHADIFFSGFTDIVEQIILAP